MICRTTTTTATALAQAKTFRFDMSDLAPAAVTCQTKTWGSTMAMSSGLMSDQFGIALPGRPTEAVSIRLPGDRERIRQFSTISSLNLLRMRLLALP